MPEIIIPNPEINISPWRRYTYQAENISFLIASQLSYQRITPQTHPQVVDLCAGDGSITKILVDNGWDPENITCVDKKISPTPLVERINWLYWDLAELARRIIYSESLPNEVAIQRNRFDIVCLWNAAEDNHTDSMGWLEKKAICAFFVKPGGYVSTDILS